MRNRAHAAAALTWILFQLALVQRAHAQPAIEPSPRGAVVTTAAPSFRYAAPCESKADFLSRLAELSGDPEVERALARRSADVSIAQTEPDQWTLTVQRNASAGTQGRVLRDKTCEQLATAARVILSVWLQEDSDLPPPEPVQPPAPPTPPPPPAAIEPNDAAASATFPAPVQDDRYSRRFFGISGVLETSTHYFVAPGAGVTGELWTMLENLRLSVALSYWTSLREWTGQPPSEWRVKGWDATAQAAIFLYHDSRLDLGVMGALSLGWMRAESVSFNGIPSLAEHIYLLPTAAGVLMWSFAPPLRLRAMAGLTQVGTSIDDLPSVYAAVGVDFEI